MIETHMNVGTEPLRFMPSDRGYEIETQVDTIYQGGGSHDIYIIRPLDV